MASKNPMNPNQMFTLFPELALELRWKIWECTFTPRKFGFQEYEDWELVPKCSPNTPDFIVRDTLDNHRHLDLPVALWVTQESRDFTLRNYQPILGKLLQTNSFYFNFAIDTLEFYSEFGTIACMCYLDKDPQCSAEIQELLSKLQFVSFENSAEDKVWHTYVMRFHNLKEISVYTAYSFLVLDSWKHFIQFRTAENITTLEQLQSRSVARNQRHFKAPVINVLNYDLSQPKTTGRTYYSTCVNLPIMEVTGPINNEQHQAQFSSLIGNGYEAVVPEWVSSDADHSHLAIWSPDEE